MDVLVVVDIKSLPESKIEEGEDNEYELVESDEKGLDEKGIESLLLDFDFDGILNILGLDDFFGENKESDLSVIVLYNPSDERGDEPDNLLLKSVFDIIVYN